jgi:hypothetical protein
LKHEKQDTQGPEVPLSTPFLQRNLKKADASKKSDHQPEHSVRLSTPGLAKDE